MRFGFEEGGREAFGFVALADGDEVGFVTLVIGAVPVGGVGMGEVMVPDGLPDFPVDVEPPGRKLVDQGRIFRYIGLAAGVALDVVAVLLDQEFVEIPAVTVRNVQVPVTPDTQGRPLIGLRPDEVCGQSGGVAFPEVLVGVDGQGQCLFGNAFQALGAQDDGAGQGTGRHLRADDGIVLPFHGGPVVARDRQGTGIVRHLADQDDGDRQVAGGLRQVAHGEVVVHLLEADGAVFKTVNRDIRFAAGEERQGRRKEYVDSFHHHSWIWP